MSMPPRIAETAAALFYARLFELDPARADVLALAERTAVLERAQQHDRAGDRQGEAKHDRPGPRPAEHPRGGRAEGGEGRLGAGLRLAATSTIRWA